MLGGEGDGVTEIAHRLGKSLDMPLSGGGSGATAVLDVIDSVMENLPDQFSETMGDCPDGACIGEPATAPASRARS